MILAGDVGGTWVRLALLDDRAERIVEERRMPSAHYGRLEDAISSFLEDSRHKITAVGIGIAGPVIDGVCKTTNLPWTVEASKLRSVAHAGKAVLVNDLVALGLGATLGRGASLRSLANGEPRKRGANVAILAAGTGLGEAAFIWSGKDYTPLGTEGGHTDFAPLSEVQHDLLRFGRERFGHVSYERFVSGPGIGLLYDFFALRNPGQLDAADVAIEKAAERNVAIVSAAMAGTSTTAHEAVCTFVDLYGAEAGNLALKTLARGGVYVGGGIAAGLLDGEWAARFMRAFLDKGRMSGLLAAVPVSVILSDNVAIFGAAHAARVAS